MSGTAPNKHYNFDRNLAFAEDLTLTVDDIIQFAAADVILEIGPGYMEADMILDVSAIDLVTTDEVYDFYLLGSNSSTFASGIEVLGHIQLGAGAAATRASLADVSSIVGRYVLPFTNERAGVIYDFVELALDVTGTTPSITFSAWIAPQSE